MRREASDDGYDEWAKLELRETPEGWRLFLGDAQLRAVTQYLQLKGKKGKSISAMCTIDRSCGSCGTLDTRSSPAVTLRCLVGGHLFSAPLDDGMLFRRHSFDRPAQGVST